MHNPAIDANTDQLIYRSYLESGNQTDRKFNRATCKCSNPNARAVFARKHSASQTS
jgi:hypothetical protein